MIGKKFEKPLQDNELMIVDDKETGESHTVKNDAPNTYAKYAEASQWCTDTQSATIADMGDYYEVIPLVQPAPTLEEKAQAIRSQRDALLSESDKYALVDNYGKLTKEEQAELCAYRTQLRDMPEQASFPDAVEFPQKPLFVKE